MILLDIFAHATERRFDNFVVQANVLVAPDLARNATAHLRIDIQRLLLKIKQLALTYKYFCFVNVCSRILFTNGCQIMVHIRLVDISHEAEQCVRFGHKEAIISTRISLFCND